MTVKRTTLALMACLAILQLPNTAFAQSTTSLQPFPLGGADAATNLQGVRISVTYQFFMEGATHTMADQGALADQGRKHLYLMLAQECVVLRETIAETCAIERASVNAQLSQQSRIKSNGIRVSGSASYRISLKEDAKSDKK